MSNNCTASHENKFHLFLFRTAIILAAMCIAGCERSPTHEKAQTYGYSEGGKQLNATFFVSPDDSVATACIFLTEFPGSSEEIRYSLVGDKYAVWIDGRGLRRATGDASTLISDFGHGVEAIQVDSSALKSLRSHVLNRRINKVSIELEEAYEPIEDSGH